MVDDIVAQYLAACYKMKILSMASSESQYWSALALANVLWKQMTREQQDVADEILADTCRKIDAVASRR